MIFNIESDLMYKFAEKKFLELYGEGTKGGNRVTLRNWNTGKLGTVGTRTDCQHTHKHTALKAALDDKEGFAAFLQQRKENDQRRISKAARSSAL